MKKYIAFPFIPIFILGFILGVGIYFLFQPQSSLETKYHSVSSGPNRSPDVEEGSVKREEMDMLLKATVKISGNAGQGTGFRVFSKDFIVSNAHVVDSCANNICNVLIQSNPDRGDEYTVSAEVVAIDDLSDLALLKFEKKVPGSYFPVGSIKDINTNEEVVHIVSLGFPAGKFELFYYNVFTVVKDLVLGDQETQKQYKYYALNIEHTAKGGASGSPVLHRYPSGEIKVIAVISAGGEGTSFAIAGDHVTDMKESYDRVFEDYEERKKREPNYNPFPVETHSHISVEREFLEEENLAGITLEAQRLFNEGKLVEAYPLLLKAEELGSYQAIDMLVEYDKIKGDCEKLRPAPKAISQSRIADLSGMDLSCVYAKEVNLKGANLTNVNFKNALFKGLVEFKSANLKGANFEGARFEHVSFLSANLEKTSFKGVDLEHTGYYREVDFRGANLQEADLSGANLRDVNFQRADLRGANIKGTQFGSAEFQGANLQGLDFTEVNMSIVNFQGADVRNAKFEDIGVGLALAIFTQAKMQGASFKNSDLYKAQFQKADLQGANFRGSELIEASFEEANLEGVQFQGAELKSTDFRDAKYEKANFTGTIDKDKAIFTQEDWDRFQWED